MKNILIFALTCAIALTATADASGSKPVKVSGRDNARTVLKNGDYTGAISSFSAIAKNSTDAGLVAEYAYALALSGWTELSLAQLDRAMILDATSKEVLYFVSQALGATGLKDAAGEISQPAPAWLGASAPAIKPLRHERDTPSSFKTALESANNLMKQARYVSSADRFERITKKWPDEQLGWAGYTIAMENIGAYKTAAKAADRDIALRRKEGDDPAAVKAVADLKKDLETRPALTDKKPKNVAQALKGRYLAFFGGNYTHTDIDSIINLNTRLGKFITNRFDVAANLGFVSGYDDSDYNGLNLGISGRFNKPLSSGSPFSMTAAARMAIEPAPENKFSFILSPGVSRFTKSGSIDLFLDLNLTGPYKGTQVMSIGYTTYFGGAK